MSRNRRKKKRTENHISETWLLPYADLLTLLLALFIVLFSMSAVDASKFQRLAKSFNGVFTGGSGVFEFPNPIDEGDLLDYAEELNAVDRQKLTDVQEKIETYMEEHELTDKFSTSLTDEGLLVTIHDSVLFESGSAAVREKDKVIAKEISQLLVMDPPREIIISGHTDNVPIYNSEFESNWELSVMRAVNFMKLILENKQLDPAKFSAKGFGEFKPVADNNTDAGRAENRRVEILVLPIIEE